MVSRRLLLSATLGCLLIGLLGIVVYLQQRIARCDAVPLLAPELLPNAKLDAPAGVGSLPTGWVGATSGISVTDFTALPGGHSLQLLGIANYVQTPEVISVHPGRVYCFKGQAITDSPAGSTTRVRVRFQWISAADVVVGKTRRPGSRWFYGNKISPQQVGQSLTQPFALRQRQRVYACACRPRPTTGCTWTRCISGMGDGGWGMGDGD